MKNKYISVGCSAPDLLPLSALTPFQERLKTRNSADIKWLANNIIEHGFHCPFFVWKDGEVNRILDGNGRFRALHYLQDKGYTLPDLPVVFIQAEDERQARRKVLELNNINGVFSMSHFLEYCKELDMEFSQIHIPGLTFVEEVKGGLPKNVDETPSPIKTSPEKTSVRVVVCPHCGAEVSISAGKRDGSNG